MKFDLQDFDVNHFRNAFAAACNFVAPKMVWRGFQYDDANWQDRKRFKERA